MLNIVVDALQNKLGEIEESIAFRSTEKEKILEEYKIKIQYIDKMLNELQEWKLQLNAAIKRETENHFEVSM